ncbi:MAG: hypothetical protein Q8L48_36705 [Archangium sp.]|nr:hypothetical protein [Archangium sp.]
MRCLAVLLLALPGSALAQQSLFNVPSTQETVPGRLFGQVQVGATPEGGEVNTTLELGLFKWLELGVNLFHMPLYRTADPHHSAVASSATLLNANVYFAPTPWLAVEVGGQGGVGFVPTSTTLLEPVFYGWATVRFEAPGRFGSWVVGGYAGTRGALGDGPPAGGLFGFELPLWEHHLHAQGDWVIGLNDVSVVVLGAVVFIGKNFQLSAGAQLPSPGSGNAFGGVLELTYVPSPAPEGEGLGEPHERPQQPRREDP